jgi:hypothetical protein
MQAMQDWHAQNLHPSSGDSDASNVFARKEGYQFRDSNLLR